MRTIDTTEFLNPTAALEATARMPSDATLDLLAETFATLSDPNRLKIVYALSKSEMCVCDLAKALGMGESNCSHQLRRLKMLRLVRSRRDGKHTYYALDDEHIERLFTDGLEHVRERK